MADPVFKDGEVLRFTKPPRIVHAVHLVAFFTLLYTGIARLWPATNVLVGGNLLLGQTIHHVAAVIFVGLPLAMMLVYWKGTMHFLKDIFSWDKDDTAWILKFVQWFIRPQSVHLPPQGKEKAGQKFTAWVILGFSVLIAGSGFVIWGAQMLPVDLVRWMYVLHDLSMVALLFFVLMHTYMGVLFPATRKSWKSMVTGYVPEAEAKHGWRKWYDGLKKQQA